MFRRTASEMRVVIFAPTGRDGALLAGSLRPLEIETIVVRDPGELLEALAVGAGCVVIAEEAMTPRTLDSIKEWEAGQPTWSDMPLVVLTLSGRATRESHTRAERLRQLGNVTLVERPVRPDTAASYVRSALRARMRQYEIRSRQEALVQANADLEQFAHSASHDLREPLRSISIYSQLLARAHASSLAPEAVGYLDLIRTSAQRMDALLDDLLAYAYASSIAEELSEPVPAEVPLSSALKNLDAAIQESGARIVIGALPDVRMRASHLAQLFQNLVGNAIKYRSPARTTEVRVSAAEAENGVWTFSVEDNGIGIPSAYKDTIFGIFKRLHSNAEYVGTGMGLAICKRIVERYGGQIWIESEPGRGSTFLFTVRN